METTAEKIIFFDLEKVKFIVKDACQLDISYAYQDLVFSEHGLFIIQFDADDSNHLSCWFNAECSEKYRVALMDSLQMTGKLNKIYVEYKGTFEMIQKENKEEIDIEFSVA